MKPFPSCKILCIEGWGNVELPRLAGKYENWMQHTRNKYVFVVHWTYSEVRLLLTLDSEVCKGCYVAITCKMQAPRWGHSLSVCIWRSTEPQKHTPLGKLDLCSAETWEMSSTQWRSYWEQMYFSLPLPSRQELTGKERPLAMLEGVYFSSSNLFLPQAALLRKLGTTLSELSLKSSKIRDTFWACKKMIYCTCQNIRMLEKYQSALFLFFAVIFLFLLVLNK